ARAASGARVCRGAWPVRAIRCNRARMAGVSSGYWGRYVTQTAAPRDAQAYSEALHPKRRRTMAFIHYVTQIQFAPGAVRQLKQECERVGIRRPLVVTDAGVRAAGVLQAALDALQGLPVAVFDGTPSNPTEAAVRAACAI